MPRTWRDAFDLGDREPPGELPEAEPGGAQEGGQGFLGRLRENLRKSREALTQEISASLFDRIDEGTWERLEEALVLADVGASTTAKVVGELEREVEAGGIEGPDAVRDRLIELLSEIAEAGEPRIDCSAHPAVIMVCGVNGTGKTTTIGKIAWHLRQELGLSVLLAAGDTFRAAAIEQLEEWAGRSGCDIVRGQPGADPASVAYDAVAAALARGTDVVIADTAGRLHTQDHLMDELSKVRRVIGKQIPEAPHETLITIDATTGQNGLRQARMFAEAVQVSGVVLTKLDGTAKGGIALAIADELGIPVKLIGVGERLEDLRPFDAGEFATALLGD